MNNYSPLFQQTAVNKVITQDWTACGRSVKQLTFNLDKKFRKYQESGHDVHNY